MSATMDPQRAKAILGIFLIIMRRRRRRCASDCRLKWARDWILRRQTHGLYNNLIKELELEDAVSYRRYFRISKECFEEILNIVGPVIKKQDTVMRKAVSVNERLALTLRFLATGETFRSLSFAYRIGDRTISGIVKETSKALYTCMKDDHLQVPNSREKWKRVADEFLEKWNYPFCIGALDGKHIQIRQPGCSGSTYFNYKHFFSVILLALVDANYRFIYVDVGSIGRNGDAGVFENSSLLAALNEGSLDIPEPGNLVGDKKCAYHMIGDDAFPLRKDLVKPFPYRNLCRENQIFNYRMSRARRVVENAFGILANRFRLFLTTIQLEPEDVEGLVLAAICLHNYLVDKRSSYISNVLDEEDENHQLLPGEWRKQATMMPLGSTHHRNASLSAKEQRNLLMAFFMHEGAVSWQDDMIVQ